MRLRVKSTDLRTSLSVNDSILISKVFFLKPRDGALEQNFKFMIPHKLQCIMNIPDYDVWRAIMKALRG